MYVFESIWNGDLLIVSVYNIVRSRGFTYACDNFDCICTSLLNPFFTWRLFFYARTKQKANVIGW